MRRVVSLLILLWAPLAPSHSQSPTETLRLRVEQLHDGGMPSVRGARLHQRDAVAHFFQQRGFEPAWRVPAAADEIRRAIVDVEHDGLTPSHYHLAEIDGLLASDARRTVADDADLQLLLTDAVAAVVDHVRYGKVRPVTLDARWNVDPRAAAPPLESVLARIAASRSIADAISESRPDHFVYRGLTDALARLRAAHAAGGWPVVPSGPTLRPGAADARVGRVRSRLIASGDLPVDVASGGDAYDPSLEAAVKRFQERHRLTPDGAIGAATVDAMNVSARSRAEQVRANIERARWVLGGLSDTFLLVNLPAFKAYYIRDGTNIWESRTQIGRAARQTPTFRADMRYLVFNPDWTVPPTILANDVLAGMKKGENPIEDKGLTIIDRRGGLVDPASIDWASITPGRFPYTLRQPPGEDNALGRVKFVFPNEHAIFLHDTPSRALFGSDTRTFSSGCIRLERPLELAELLLSGQDDWSAQKITAVIDSGRSVTVPLARPLPVVIVYWTVSVGGTGDLRFARDVYVRDAPLLRALNAR